MSRPERPPAGRWVVPGVAAAGHLSPSGGAWHPGRPGGCPKCPDDQHDDDQHDDDQAGRGAGDQHPEVNR